MSKDEFVSVLREKGYKAENAEGCVMITVKTMPKKTENSKLVRLMKEYGYSGSYGWRQERKEVCDG